MLSFGFRMNNSGAGPSGGNVNVGTTSNIANSMGGSSSSSASSGSNSGNSNNAGNSSSGSGQSNGSGVSVASGTDNNIAGGSAGLIGNNSGNGIATIGSSSGSGNSSSSVPLPLSTKRRAALLNCNNNSTSSTVVNSGAGTSTASVSACPSQVPITADLAALFECPVCFEYVLPPIIQCHGGHLVCSNCRPKLTSCPTCRGPLGNIRNLAMEKVAGTILFPCKYSSSGCSACLSHSEKVEHEEVCEWRPYTCPCPGASCKWQGGLEEVMPHLMVSHKSITTLQGEDIVFLATDITLPGAVDWVMMQSCFGHNFMLVLEKQEKFDGHQQFFAIVQLIGSRKQAEHFAYRLELNGPKRRLTWEATPRSIHEGVSTAIMNSDCLVFDTSIAQLFSDNGNLGINVTITNLS